LSNNETSAVEFPASEADLLQFTRKILELLKKLGMLDFTRIHVFGMVRNGRVVGKNRDMKGFSDFEIVAPPGIVGYLELKSRDGILSEDQETFLSSRSRIGCLTAHAKTRRDVVNFIRTMGVDIDGVLKGIRT